MRYAGIVVAMITLIGFSLPAQTYLDPSAPVEERVQDLLSRMTLEEKIGQMTQADRGALSSAQDIKTYYLGSILSGGGSAPAVNTATGWADMVDGFQSKALETRLKIPIIYGIDAVHGHNNVKGAVIFPHNIGMGCTWDSTVVKEAARITAREVAGTGIGWTFAPCIAVARDERWGRTYEGFGETPEVTVMMAGAAVRGYQGDSLANRGSIVACAKHYVGDGGTTGGIDQGNTELDEATLRAIHLPAYIEAIDAGVGTVMASYSSWNGEKIHGNAYLLTDVLKTELGFKGFVVSDWAGIDQLSGDYSSDVKQSIMAGIDMVMVPDKYTTFIADLKSLVNSGDILMSRIDDAVSRILRIKFEMGLFEHPYTDRSLTDSVGCAEHRLVARKSVSESMVLLQKENGILPLSQTAGKMLVAGSKADNLGYQCGGWTISWQGGSGNITSGTTIYSAIRNSVSGANVVFSEDGSGVTDADVAVVVVGERPYAEGQGDDDDLQLDRRDIDTVRRIKAAGIPTVVILISGRPLIIDTILHDADVLFAAWLPGTEGEGIADVLFGDVQPSGRLSHSWPRSAEQLPLNWGDSGYHPLYPYRYGITSISDYGSTEAPLFHSAVLLKGGDTVDVAFSKPMAAPGAGSAGFQILVNGAPATIAAVNLNPQDSNNLQIKLEAPANAGDKISIFYTPGTISASDGSLLEAFGPGDVYNLRNEGSGAQLIPGRVEAENYSAMYGIQVEQTADVGGGSNVGYIDANDWMEYQLQVPDSGRYHVDLRTAAESRAGRLGLVINGVVQAVVDIPVTGGWQAWETVSTEITLDEGIQTLKVFAFIGGFNLNWMDFSSLTAIRAEVLSPREFKLWQNYPNPFNSQTVISYTLPRAERVSLRIYDLLGQEVANLASGYQTDGDKRIIWKAANIPSGVYLVRLKAGSYEAVRKIILSK